MIRKLLIFFFLAVFSFSVYGQDSRAYQSRWQTRTLVGTNIPITRLLQGAETDYLLEFDNNSFCWQISVSYFFHKRWGAEFSFHLNTSSQMRQRNDNFIAGMQSRYGDNYYVSARTGNLYRFDSFNRGLLGIIYRFETDRFYVYPRFAIGVTNFWADWGSTNLKRKNANIVYEIKYQNSRVRGLALASPTDHFTLAPSVSFGYKLTNRLFLNADIMFSYFRPNIVYERTKTNLFTNESSVQRFEYRNGVASLSLGVGLVFVIR